jgi:hypothetical protein
MFEGRAGITERAKSKAEGGKEAHKDEENVEDVHGVLLGC